MNTTLTPNLLSLLSSKGNINLSAESATKSPGSSLVQKEELTVSTMLKDKNVQGLLKNLLNDMIGNNKSNKAILETLKNSSVFKNFTQFSSEVRVLMDLLASKNIESQSTHDLKNALPNISEVDNKILKESISKSGVFLESYLKKMSSTLNDKELSNIKKNIISDIKTLLLQVNEDASKSDIQGSNKEVFKQIDKMLTQIEYYQLLSLSNSSNNTYLPFTWDDLKDGDIEFKQKDENNFVCHINLELEEYGKINMKLIFNNQSDLNLAFFIQKEELKEKVQEKMQNLRLTLKNIDVNLVGLNIFDLDNEKNKEISAFTKYNDLRFGVDIKA